MSPPGARLCPYVSWLRVAREKKGWMDGKGKLELGNGGTGGRRGTLPRCHCNGLCQEVLKKKWQFSLSLSDDMGNLGPWPRRAVWKLAIFGLPISAVLNTDEVEGWKIGFFLLASVFFLIDWLIDFVNHWPRLRARERISMKVWEAGVEHPTKKCSKSQTNF